MNETSVEAVIPPVASDYIHAAEELTKLYKPINKSLLSMPIASATPFFVFLWSYIKTPFGLFLDLFLFIPINIVVFVRNLFPERWGYKSFSWPYIHYCYSWVAAGECYYATFFVRPLTEFILNAHFRNQLTALRRRLLLEESISEDDQKAVLSKIDGSLNLWQSSTVASVFFTYVFPATGPIVSLWSHLIPASLPDWTEYLVVPSISYGLSLFGTAFLVKRGLMLGATGRSAYFPGALTQSGAYMKEREILNRIGVTAFEFPIDILVLAVGILLGLISWKQQVRFLNYEHDLISRLCGQEHVQVDTDMNFYVILGSYTFILIIACVAWQRRKKLQRL